MRTIVHQLRNEQRGDLRVRTLQNPSEAEEISLELSASSKLLYLFFATYERGSLRSYPRAQSSSDGTVVHVI